MQYTTLYNGIKIPVIGYGTFQLSDATLCEQCVDHALKAGYRLIDTAAYYQNEEAVDNAIYHSGIPREEIFLTTKLWVQDAGYDAALKAFDISMKKLRSDYIDLYFIQQPFNDYYGAWRAMERLYRDGAVRAIGVSNFSPERLVDLCMNQEIKPMINQVEIHPFFQQSEALNVMKDYSIVPQAWGTLSEAQRDIFNHKLLVKIAQKHEKTVAQVILRWHFQRGVATIPKTIHPERMEENLDIFNFTLTDKEMNTIAGMDIGHSEIIDHRCYYTARQLNSVKIHA